MIVPVGVNGWEVGCCSRDVEVGGVWTAWLRFLGDLDPANDERPRQVSVVDADSGVVEVTATLSKVVRHGNSTKRRGAVGAIGFAWNGHALGLVVGHGRFVHAGHEDVSHAKAIDATGVVRRIRWSALEGGGATDLKRVDRSDGHYRFDLELPDG